MTKIKMNLDISKTPAITPVLRQRQNDVTAYTADVQITKNGEAFDLTGYKISFEGITSKGNKVIDDTGVTVTDATKGQFTYAFSKEGLRDVGQYEKAYFSLSNETKRETSNDFGVFVLASADLTEDETGDYLSEYEKMLEQLRAMYISLNIDQIREDMENLQFEMDTLSADVKQQLEAVKSETQAVIDEIMKTLADKGVVDLTSAQTVAGAKIFTDAPLFNSGAKSLKNVTVSSSATSGGAGTEVGTVISADGSVEITHTTSPFIDFHKKNATPTDYDLRLLNGKVGKLDIVSPITSTAGASNRATVDAMLSQVSIAPNTDLNSLTDTLSYYNGSATGIKNAPSGTTGTYFTLRVQSISAITGSQVYWDINTGKMFWRTWHNSPVVFETWREAPNLNSVVNLTSAQNIAGAKVFTGASYSTSVATWSQVVNGIAFELKRVGETVTLTANTLDEDTGATAAIANWETALVFPAGYTNVTGGDKFKFPFYVGNTPVWFHSDGTALYKRDGDIAQGAILQGSTTWITTADWPA